MIYQAKELRVYLKYLTLTQENGEISWIGTKEERQRAEEEANALTYEEWSVADLDISPDGNYNRI